MARRFVYAPKDRAAAASTRSFADTCQAWLAHPRRHLTYENLQSNEARKVYADHCASLLQRLRRANRFAFDDAFVTTAVDVASTLVGGDKVEGAMALARVPHPVTWLEWNQGVRLRHQMATGTMLALEDPSDRMAGFLIEAANPEATQYTVHGFYSPGLKGDGAGLFSAVWLLDLEATEERPLMYVNQWHHAFSGRDSKARQDRAFLFVGKDGETITPPPEAPWAQGRVDLGLRCIGYGLTGERGNMERIAGSIRLAAMTGVAVDVGLGAIMMERPTDDRLIDVFYGEVREARGDLRFLGAALGLINRVPVSYHLAEPRGHYLTAGKSHPYLRYRVIRLEVPGRRAVPMFGRLVKAAMAILARRIDHPVRGHWRTVKDPDAPGGTRETWIKSHRRGDPALGTIHHDYEVGTGKPITRRVPPPEPPPVDLAAAIVRHLGPQPGKEPSP